MMKIILTGLIPIYGIYFFFKNLEEFNSFQAYTHGVFCSISNVWLPYLIYTNLIK